MQARRNALLNVKVTERVHTHAGLWLDKYLTDQTVEGVRDDRATAAKAVLIQEVSQFGIPTGYQKSFEHREKLFADLEKKGHALCGKATTQGRMIIGLGQKGPVEAGLALEHTWGVPMIPGSALKGLTMAAAHLLLEDEAWRKPQGDQKEPGTSLATLAGTIKHIGEVIFHDAWWIPEGEKLPIHPDVMTVHHADYYPNGEVSPSDMDNPNPVPFASVTGKYLVVVERTFPIKPDAQDELLDAARYILKLGLHHLGIGAKTNAGYGRMTLELKAGLEVETLQQAVDRVCASAEGRRDAFMSEPFESLLQAVPIHERSTALLVMKPLFEDKKLKRKCQSELEQLRRILEGEE